MSQDDKVALYPKNATSAELYKLLKDSYKIKVIDSPQTGFDAYIICDDNDKVVYLKELARCDWQNDFPKVITAGNGHPTANQQLVQSIEKKNGITSYAVGYDFTKAHIYESLKLLKMLNKSGYVIELGCFKGGTLALIEKLCEELNIQNKVSLVGFDSWDNDFHKSHFLDIFDLKKFVSSDIEFARKAVSKKTTLIKGDIKDTFDDWVKQIKRPIVLAFIDTDNYFATSKSLPKIWENLEVGGSIIFDHFYTQEDFYNTLGEHIAAKDFFEERKDYFNLTGTGVFLKLR